MNVTNADSATQNPAASIMLVPSCSDNSPATCNHKNTHTHTLLPHSHKSSFSHYRHNTHYSTHADPHNHMLWLFQVKQQKQQPVSSLVFLLTCLSDHLSVCSPVYLTVWSSVCLLTCLPDCLITWLSDHLSLCSPGCHVSFHPHLRLHTHAEKLE